MYKKIEYKDGLHSSIFYALPSNCGNGKNLKRMTFTWKTCKIRDDVFQLELSWKPPMTDLEQKSIDRILAKIKSATSQWNVVEENPAIDIFP